MSSDKYFEREYNFLQTEGNEFAKKHPTLGSKLHLSEREKKDPFVERLFEGFAFLAGRIHERLDDEFPEIAGGILEILFPHLLKAFPACAILQARIKTGAFTEPILINRASEIQTPAGKFRVKYKVQAGPDESSRITEKEEPADFIFRTTQDILLRPIKLKEVKVVESNYGTSSLILRLQLDRNVDYNTLRMDHFNIYLHGAASVKYNLHYYLNNFVTTISVREFSNEKSSYYGIQDFRIEVPELVRDLDDNEEYSLLPYSKQSFIGFRLLQEYFSFPEKFFFINILGLQQFISTGESDIIEIKIDFNRKLSREKYPDSENILINCVPIINLFSRATEEVAITQRLPEYYVIPDLYRRKSREIYSVDKVNGISEDRSQEYIYIPITSHDVLDSSRPEYDYKRFYSIFRRPLQSDMTETYIRIFGPGMELENFPKEILNLEATLSNGFLPSAYLETGSIREPLDFPPGVEASNITVPSEVLESPDRKNYLWSLISHLSFSFTTLADTDTLKSVLNLYNWQKKHNHSNKKRIEGIREIKPPKLTSKVMNQGVVRGIEFHIEIDPKEFENGEGDIYLFGMVLNAFLSQYVTLNSFVFLKITEIGTEKHYTWDPLIGRLTTV